LNSFEACASCNHLLLKLFVLFDDKGDLGTLLVLFEFFSSGQNLGEEEGDESLMTDNRIYKECFASL